MSSSLPTAQNGKQSLMPNALIVSFLTLKTANVGTILPTYIIHGHHAIQSNAAENSKVRNKPHGL
jgi:hypothetical protein